ncbi:MAG: VTT domain-containing protein [Lachnospiraceae bacterium]|nr:VTT domain-containing protein [Robinsoniella sp.]MDY3767875.1 VTT domain-containing protein [Lachnospiraceae bacterium]
MNQSKNKKWISILKILPLALCVVLIIGYLAAGREISVQTLLEYTPANPVLAACVLLLIYAVKSVSVVFPLMVIRLTVGHLFPTAIALLINLAGMIICFTIPYWIGHFSGTDTVNSLKEKYPKLELWLDIQQSNDFFLCFFFRIIGCLPVDIVSMYFGATKVPFLLYLSGSLLGALPNIITSTLLGSSITEPGSPMFIVSATLTVLLAGLSLLGHFLNKHKCNHKKRVS